MAKWSSMTTDERVKYLEKRLEEIRTCQRLLSEFERMTSLRIDALNEEEEAHHK